MVEGWGVEDVIRVRVRVREGIQFLLELGRAEDAEHFPRENTVYTLAKGLNLLTYHTAHTQCTRSSTRTRERRGERMRYNVSQQQQPTNSPAASTERRLLQLLHQLQPSYRFTHLFPTPSPLARSCAW